MSLREGDQWTIGGDGLLPAQALGSGIFGFSIAARFNGAH